MEANKSIYPPIGEERLKPVAVLAKNWSFFSLLLLILIFSFTGKGFFSLVNFQNIVHLSTAFLLLASAETFVIITGGIDLSVGFIVGAEESECTL